MLMPGKYRMSEVCAYTLGKAVRLNSEPIIDRFTGRLREFDCSLVNDVGLR
jgi:hypothetical protein